MKKAARTLLVLAALGLAVFAAWTGSGPLGIALLGASFCG